MHTPSASNTSALPVWLDIDRLPCLATRAPAPAITNAATVETLKVLRPSPPVPHVSIKGSPASTKIMRSRMARANPASSAEVSPFIRRAMRKAAMSDSLAAPSSNTLMALCASSAER